eukprot:symbB.v1.2.023741.t1/scaffold2197.1/size86103/3
MEPRCLSTCQNPALSLLIPSTDCRTYVAFPDSAECDPEYRLAEKPPLLDALVAAPLLPPDIMSLENPWLESWRAPRQVRDPFQYSDAFEANFAEAGAALGPLPGSDLGGQRLSFMPAGGLERDLPSDTDDDEQPEFNIPAPGPEMKDVAISNLEGPVSSEMWYKQGLAEEPCTKKIQHHGVGNCGWVDDYGRHRQIQSMTKCIQMPTTFLNFIITLLILMLQERLQELCASSSRAVRDRLTNLNSEMTGYKLYLG